MVILPAALALLLASPQSLTETIEVRLHTVDVVVTNTSGEPVTGLRADDFEILEDGVPQTVTNFSAFSETAAARAAQPGSEQAPPRTLVFFIDEMGLVGSTRDDLLANLRAFTANFREGDRAAVVRPSEATTIALKLTSDRQVIERDLEAALSDSVIKGRRVGLAGDYYWYQRDKQMAMGSNAVRTVTRRAAERTTQRVKQRLGTIRAIIATLAPIEGRKVLIGVTQSLSAEPGREFFDDYVNSHRNERFSVASEVLDLEQRVSSETVNGGERDLVLKDMREAIAGIARVASSNGVTFYAIRPENDLTLSDATPDLAFVSTSQHVAMNSCPNMSKALFLQGAIGNTENGVNPLVDITGGRHFDPSDRFSDVMRRIAGDLSSYYSLAYHGQAGLDRPRKIAVRVRNRPDLQVRARSEVESKSAPRELTDRVVSSLVATQAPNDLGIAVRAGSKTVRKDKTLTIDILIPLAALSFEKAGNVYRASYSAHYAITGHATDFVSGVDRDRTIEIPARDFEVARTQHWTHTVTMNGTGQEYRVAVGVMDLRNERSGIVTVDIAK